MRLHFTNAPAVFQALVNDDMISNLVFLYLNYILIFSKAL